MTALLALVLVVAVGALGVVLANAQARFAFVEAALTNGFAPRPSVATADAAAADHEHVFDPSSVAPLVGDDAVVLFVSATCSTCVRLVDDLSDPSVPTEIDFQLFFEQDPPMVARRGQIHERQRDLINTLGVPAMPYAVVMASGEPAAHGPVPHTGRLDALLAAAGHRYRLPQSVVGAQ